MPESSFLPMHRPDHRSLAMIDLYLRYYPSSLEVRKDLEGMSEAAVANIASEMSLLKSYSKAILIERILNLLQDHGLPARN